MTSGKLEKSTERYAQEFRYWKDTAVQFFEIAERKINDVLRTETDDTTAVEMIADAWHKCMAAQWTLFKSGKQTANRMALRRGVDNRQFHPAQTKKKKAVEDEVESALEGKSRKN